jgi:hypothetical protein
MLHPTITQIGLLYVNKITRWLLHNMFERIDVVDFSEAKFAVVLMSSCGDGRVTI